MGISHAAMMSWHFPFPWSHKAGDATNYVKNVADALSALSSDWIV